MTFDFNDYIYSDQNYAAMNAAAGRETVPLGTTTRSRTVTVVGTTITRMREAGLI